MAIETILKILKTRKRGIVVKIIYPYLKRSPRNYMIVLLNDKSKLCGNNDLLAEFAVNLVGQPSSHIGVSGGYCVKPTVQDYLELWDMYRRYKKNK